MVVWFGGDLGKFLKGGFERKRKDKKEPGGGWDYCCEGEYGDMAWIARFFIEMINRMVFFLGFWDL